MIPCILFEKNIYINILAFEKATSPWNRHCANCTGFRSRWLRSSRELGAHTAEVVRDSRSCSVPRRSESDEVVSTSPRRVDRRPATMLFCDSATKIDDRCRRRHVSPRRSAGVRPAGLNDLLNCQLVDHAGGAPSGRAANAITMSTAAGVHDTQFPDILRLPRTSTPTQRNVNL